jgi:hypothetical protein
MEVLEGVYYEAFRKEGFEVVKDSMGYYYIRPFNIEATIENLSIAKEAAIKRGFILSGLNIIGYAR